MTLLLVSTTSTVTPSLGLSRPPAPPQVLQLQLAEVHSEPTPAWWATMATSVAVSAIGAGLIVYAAAQSPAGEEVCFSASGGCPVGMPWLRFGFAKASDNIRLDTSPYGTGLAIAPLGISLLAGSMLAGSLTFLSEDELPWWQVLVGVAASLITYPIVEAAAPPSVFDYQPARP